MPNTVHEPRRVVSDLWVLPVAQEAPGHGILPVNSYLFRDSGPLLVDTGMEEDRDDLLDALWGLVAPDELTGIFLTHEDPDHSGNLEPLLEAAPRATLFANYVTITKLLETPVSLPLDRVAVVNPGDPVPGHDRLTAFRPPLYDSPGTLGLHDSATGAALCVDCFGAYLPEMVTSADALATTDLVDGAVDFNRMNHPWVALADQRRFDAVLDAVRALEPTVLLSSHGVDSGDRIGELIELLRGLPAMEPFAPPDQQRYEELRPALGD
jgi:flavorubredoxin